MTTNGTILSDGILEFCRCWRIGFHTSIDGHPEVQNAHRVYRNGRGSANALARNLPRILGIWPRATARSTVVPDVAGEVYRSYQYFLSLGYKDMAFVPGNIVQWDEESVKLFEREFSLVGDHVIDQFRAGQEIRVKYIHEMCQARAAGITAAGHPSCGAGRGMALIDVEGEIWPCHRWNRGLNSDEWKQGSLYDPMFHEGRRHPFHAMPDVDAEQATTCLGCEASPICRGGCPAENLELTGGIYFPHPKSCELQAAVARVGDRVYETLHAERDPLLLSKYHDAESQDEESGTKPAAVVGSKPARAPQAS